jgi:iron complex outermembrane receptor protein
MEKFILSILFLTATFWSVAQEQSVSGIVIDNVSKESLIGANVVYAKGKGVITDIDGKFSLQLKEGEYTLSISYIGYKTMELDIIVGNTPLELEVALEIITLNEVEIVADIAQSRRSPVAFSSISQQVIQEEGGNQDLPMLLNTTPSVYATQEGGGVGDAEIIMRGFDQRNLAVMVDGIPVNDMENGRVYWSNWNLPVANMQVQRGLSISKLATPSVGGTINVITPGIIGEKKFQIQQQFASGNFLKTDFTFNSGKLKNGWGYAIALSYWQGDGIIDGTWSQGGSYFAKLEKITGKHRISLTGFGAPQKHGQRSFKNPMSVYNRDYAREIGFDAGALDSVPEYGMTYNEHWGTYEDYEFIGIGTEHPITGELSFDHWRITRHGSKITLNERSNFFHKPMFSLRDFWTISNRSVLVTTVYASFGRGGGTGLDSRGNAKFENTLAFPDSLVFTGTIGQLDFQSLYNGNRQAVNNSDYGFINIDPQYSNSEIKGSDFIRANMNNHNWFGFLSQFSHSMGEHLNLSTGIDLRTYKGSHFGEVYNLIGADYTLDVSDANQGERVARVGDKVAYYNVSYVRWAGGYGQLEYSSDKLTAFVNATIAHTRYKRIDFFKLREEASKPEETDWITFMGFTAKGGINYNLTERHSVYGNLGTLNNAPKFNTVINFSNEVNDDVENERIYSTELGYKYSSPRFALAFNGYYTIWENRQVNRNISVPYPSEAVNWRPTN